MALNPNLTNLDWNAALKRCIDSLEDSLRIKLADTTGMAVELSAADGDSVLTQRQVTSSTGTLTVATTGVVVAALNVEGYQEFQLLVDVGAGLTGSADLLLEISPSASANVWFPTVSTLTATGSTNLLSTSNTDIAKRARISISGSNTISVGTATVYLMART